MRKAVKKQLLDIFKTIYEAHDKIKESIEKKDCDTAIALLGECQNTAAQIGSVIDESEGEKTATVRLLEDYCEELYKASLALCDELECNAGKVRKTIEKALIKAENSVKNDIRITLEIVFMPYKASMWDSLESIWFAAKDDPDCDAYVVPIPYYDRNPDHSFGTFHYEGTGMPDYVPVVDYKSYDLEKRRPDIIYIHNPYDGHNYVTSVDPRYYSNELKKYTDMLVYVPYYIFNENYDDDKFVIAPVFFNCDRVIVQSEKVGSIYSKVYKDYADVSPNIIQQKVRILGTPKIDAIVNKKENCYTVPNDWNSIISGRKIVLYNTSICWALNYRETYLKKILNTIQYFKNSKDMVLWWRPHPLLESTFESMMPSLYDKFKIIKRNYINSRIGIYDDTTDSSRAVMLSDIYYGDRASTMVYSFAFTNKPIVYADVDSTSISNFDYDYKNNQIPDYELALYRDNENTDGSAGAKIHQRIKEEIV